MARYSDEELLEVIDQLASEKGRPPTLQEIDEETDYSRTVYFSHFGSWQAALAEAGYEPRPPQTEISNEELISELQRLGAELGRRPTIHEMNEKGKYWGSTFKNHFESWAAAVDEAGFDPADVGQQIGRENLLAELDRVGDALGKRPTFREMEEHGKYDPTTYIREFGSWTRALEIAGFTPPTGVTPDSLVQHLLELAETLDKQPSQRDMNEHGEHSHTTYVRYFGSWSNAIQIAFEN